MIDSDGRFRSVSARGTGAEPHGRVVVETVESAALRGNPLGDPFRRRLLVWLPPGYDNAPGERYPAVYFLQGYGHAVEDWCNRSLFDPTIFERLEALYAGDDRPPPCLAVFPDAATAYGGSQFVNSAATGDYQDYLCDEVVAHVDARFRTLAGAGHRGAAGHSSGGIGALVLSMRRPDVFGACASHAGDSLFEHCYGRELADFARALAENHGDVMALRDRLLGDEAYRRQRFGPLMVLGCAAAYSPDQSAPLGIGLPVDATGAIQPQHWERWLEHDPVRLAAAHAEELRRCRAIWLDAGDQDEYYMDLGTAALHAVLDDLGVPHTYQRFSGTHSGISYRYPLAFAHLARRLAGH